MRAIIDVDHRLMDWQTLLHQPARLTHAPPCPQISSQLWLVPSPRASTSHRRAPTPVRNPCPNAGHPGTPPRQPPHGHEDRTPGAGRCLPRAARKKGVDHARRRQSASQVCATLPPPHRLEHGLPQRPRRRSVASRRAPGVLSVRAMCGWRCAVEGCRTAANRAGRTVWSSAVVAFWRLVLGGCHWKG